VSLTVGRRGSRSKEIPLQTAFAYPQTFLSQESFAVKLDAADPLAQYRARFFIPEISNDRAAIYLCSHSLGLQPRDVVPLMQAELDQWARLGVEGHVRGQNPWYTYQNGLCEATARLVGAQPGE